MNDARHQFVSTLKTHREQLGITIAEIAHSTKIGSGLLEALERSDLSRWPKGISRRAFFREYVAAIGLPPESLVSEFARLFPDEPSALHGGETPTGLRLALAEAHSPVGAASKRAAIVGIELVAIAVAGVVSGWVLGAEMLSAVGVVALVYYPISNLCVERRVGVRTLRALVTSAVPPSISGSPGDEAEGHKNIEGHEELQVSY